MPIVVWLAIVIEAAQAIAQWPGDEATTSLIDVFVLLLLQFLNVFVAFFEELKAKESIDALQDSLPSQVSQTVLTAECWMPDAGCWLLAAGCWLLAASWVTEHCCSTGCSLSSISQ